MNINNIITIAYYTDSDRDPVNINDMSNSINHINRITGNGYKLDRVFYTRYKSNKTIYNKRKYVNYRKIARDYILDNRIDNKLGVPEICINSNNHNIYTVIIPVYMNLYDYTLNIAKNKMEISEEYLLTKNWLIRHKNDYIKVITYLMKKEYEDNVKYINNEVDRSLMKSELINTKFEKIDKCMNNTYALKLTFKHIPR